MNYLGACETKLTNHASNIANILSFVSINGVIPGAEFYGVTPNPDAGDIKFNPGALQMALDAVDAHIKATEQYIALLQEKIAANTTKIEVLHAKARAAEAKDEDASGYYAEIAALEAENVQLQASVQDYTDKLHQENEIYNELANYWNSYNKVCGGLGSAFVAVDFMDKLSGVNGDANFYGLQLTDTQRKELFNNLGKTISGFSGDLSSVFNSKNEYCGGLTADQIGFIVAGCNILGQSGTTFQENINKFKDFNNAATAAGGFDKMNQETIDKFTGGNNASSKQGDATQTDSTKADTGKDGASASSTDKKTDIESGDKADDKDSTKKASDIDPSKAVVATLDGCKLALQYTADHKVKSDVVMSETAETFMTTNAGKTVIVPPTVLKALDMQTRGYMSIPKGYNTEDAYPFLLWLPGTGFHANGQDSLKTDFTGEPLLKQLLNGKMNNDMGIIFISTGWGEGSYEQQNSKYHIDPINHDLHQIINNLNVDKEHIACAGSSIGAFATAALVQKNPNLFSAVAMTGGGFNGPFQSVDFYDALKNSPDTSYIWVMAPDDKTSPGTWYDDKTGKSQQLGVSYYTYQQHLKLMEAGRNSMFYEFGSQFDFKYHQETGIWHSNTVDRFPNTNMIKDLFTITKGVKYNYPELSERNTIIVNALDTVSGDRKLDPNLPWYQRVA